MAEGQSMLGAPPEQGLHPLNQIETLRTRNRALHLLIWAVLLLIMLVDRVAAIASSPTSRTRGSFDLRSSGPWRA